MKKVQNEQKELKMAQKCILTSTRNLVKIHKQVLPEKIKFMDLFNLKVVLSCELLEIYHLAIKDAPWHLSG